MVEVEHADANKFGSSMSSCLPLLVFHHHHPNNSQEDDEDEDEVEVEDEMLMFSISDQSLHRNMECGHDSEGNSSMCWTTPQGWMVLLAQDRDTVSSVCLWNPCTGDKLPLPDIVEEEHQIPFHCKCILSNKDPTHPGCVVVVFNGAAPEFWYCHTATTNDSSSNSSRWRHCTYNNGNYPSIPKPPKGKKARRPRRPIKNTIVHMASFQGKIYFRNSKKDMCAIDFSSCTSTTNHNDRPTFQKFNFRMVGLPEEFSSGKQWLVESQDQLFVVTICFVDFNPNNIGAIEVHRMDSSSSSSQDRWRKVHDIGDVVFLLEDANIVTSCSASALGLKANRIFFMKNFLDDDGDLCIFDLETNTQEITRVHDHEDLVLCRKPFWIVPPS